MTQKLALQAMVKNTSSRASFSPGRYEPKASSALPVTVFLNIGCRADMDDMVQAFENTHQDRAALDNGARRAQTKGAGGAR